MGSAWVSEQLETAVKYGAERAKEAYDERTDGERRRIGEYDSDALSGIMQELLGVKVKTSSVDDDGAIHLYVNASDDVKDVAGGSKIRDGEIVIRNGKVDILIGGKYAKNWSREVIEKLMAGTEGFGDSAFDTFRDSLGKMDDAERARVIEEGDPNGILGEISKVIGEKGIGTHGEEHLEGRKSIVTMNTDEATGQTRYQVGHELSHAMLDQMRVSGALPKELEDRLAKYYGAPDDWRETGNIQWEEDCVDDALNSFLKTGDAIAAEVEDKIIKTFGERKVKDAIVESIKSPMLALRDAVVKMRNSVMREEAVKSGFEKFIENRISKAAEAESNRKTSEERRAELAEHVKAFDRVLGEKIESGDRIGAEDITAKPTGAEEGNAHQENAPALAIEDKTKALEEAGYIRTADGSWVCEKTNAAEWHRACVASAREKLRNGETLNKQEREHLGIVIDETGNTVDVVQVVDTVNDGEHGLCFRDEKGNAYQREDVGIVPFPADASKKFMKEAYEILAPRKFGVGNMKGLITPKDEKLKRAPLAIGRITGKKAWIDIFNPSHNEPVRIANAIFEQAANGTENGGARHTYAHIFDLGLTWDAIRNTYKGPLTLQEINDYLEACLTYVEPVSVGYGDKYERKMAIDPDPSNPALRTNFVVITAKLTAEESARNGGAKERIITVMSTRNGWKVEKMVKNAGGDLEKSQIPEGRAETPPTEDSIPNYLRGFKGVPNKKEANEKVDAMLKAQQERGRTSPWLPDDLSIYHTHDPLVVSATPDTRKFNVGGIRGIERMLGTKEAKKIYDEINGIYRNTYNHIAEELIKGHHTQGGVTKPRMWQIEEKMQDGGVKLSMKVGGKTMHIHFTGAGHAVDPKSKGAEGRKLLANPRFEYAGPAAKIGEKDVSDIRDGKDKRVGEVLKDKILTEMYPEIAYAKIVMAGEDAPIDATGIGTANVVRSLDPKDLRRVKLVRNYAVRQEIKTDRGRTRHMLCSAIPKLNTIVVYPDALKRGNAVKLGKDLMQSVVDMISAEEGWGDGSQFALKTVGSRATSRRNNTNSSSGKVDGSFYRTFALFGDPKLSVIDPDSLLNKTISKYVRQYEKKGSEADALTEEKVRAAIVEVLADAYQQFAGVMESKAWASRMGKDARGLKGRDEALTDVGKRGLVETGKGGQSERASEAVIRYYDETVAARIDKAFGKMFKKNDKTFRQLFEKEREEFRIQREAETAARSFNPTKVRSEAAYQAYLAYCKSHDIKPRPEAKKV